MSPALLAKALILGVVQGLTEFLPISSAGHLELLDRLLSYLMPGVPNLDKAFQVACHFGTLLALVVYFRGEVAMLLKATLGLLVERSLGDPERSPLNYRYRRLAALLAVGSAPVAMLGFLYEKVLEERFGAIPYIAAFLVIFGLLLWVADRYGAGEREVGSLGFWDVLAIGMGQSLALMPGVSRSGATMTMGMALGLSRREAAHFSFLLALPVIAGASLWKFFKVGAIGVPGLVGLLAAFVSGLICVHWLMGYLRRGSFTPFVLYRVVLGSLLLSILGSAMPHLY